MCSGLPDPGPPPSFPTIAFILTEDQGAQLGFVGTAGIQTPHMDSLARRGVYFNNAFVAYPVCSSSKACIYTGLHNHASGIMNNTLNFHGPASELTPAQLNNPLFKRNRIQEDIPTLVERLHSAGYYQGLTHKLHVAPNDKFPYDEFIKGTGGEVVTGFIGRAKQAPPPFPRPPVRPNGSFRGLPQKANS